MDFKKNYKRAAECLYKIEEKIKELSIEEKFKTRNKEAKEIW